MVDNLFSGHLYTLLREEDPELSHENLARRMRRLWHHRYLERPESQRPLRRVASSVGRSGNRGSSWKGFLFSHMDTFSLEEAESILEPIFFYPDERRPVALLPKKR